MKIELSWLSTNSFTFGIYGACGYDENGDFSMICIGVFLFDITFYFYEKK